MEIKNFFISLKGMRSLKAKQQALRNHRSKINEVDNFDFSMAVSAMLTTGRKQQFDAAFERALASL